jgi:uncharacterized membrane protein
MGLTPLYLLLAFLFAATAWHGVRAKRRLDDVAYWALLALLFCIGDLLPPALVGAAVIALALLAGFGKVGRSARGEPHGATPRTVDVGDRVFVPVLAIPLITVSLVLGLKAFGIEGSTPTLLALGVACLVALEVAIVSTRATVSQGLEAGSDLLDTVGWAPLLPLMLAMLGAVFVQSHVGDAIAGLVAQAIPVESRLACIVAYGLGMVLFTAIMGNAFAAFPVMTAGIALPLLVGQHGANVAPLAAIGMLTGYCGTLLTPMAANFNLIPVALLELEDDWAVIKAQAPTGLALMVVNIALLYFLT